MHVYRHWFTIRRPIQVCSRGKDPLFSRGWDTLTFEPDGFNRENEEYDGRRKRPPPPLGQLFLLASLGEDSADSRWLVAYGPDCLGNRAGFFIMRESRIVAVKVSVTYPSAILLPLRREVVVVGCICGTVGVGVGMDTAFIYTHREICAKGGRICCNA